MLILMRGRFPKYRKYAMATIDSVLTAGMKKQAYTLTANNTQLETALSEKNSELAKTKSAINSILKQKIKPVLLFGKKMILCD